jgi:hypothetical protein
LIHGPVDSIDVANRNGIANALSESVYAAQRIEGRGTSASSEQAGWRDANASPDGTIAANLAFGWISEESLLSNSFGHSGKTTSAFGLWFPSSVHRIVSTRIGNENALSSGAQVLNQTLLPQFPNDGLEPVGGSTSEILDLNQAPEPGYQCLLALGLFGLVFASRRAGSLRPAAGYFRLR